MQRRRETSRRVERTLERWSGGPLGVLVEINMFEVEQIQPTSGLHETTRVSSPTDLTSSIMAQAYWKVGTLLNVKEWTGDRVLGLSGGRWRIVVRTNSEQAADLRSTTGCDQLI